MNQVKGGATVLPVKANEGSVMTHMCRMLPGSRQAEHSAQAGAVWNDEVASNTRTCFDSLTLCRWLSTGEVAQRLYVRSSKGCCIRT